MTDPRVEAGDRALETARNERDSAIKRLAKFIANKESLNCKTLDEALYHQSKWQRIIPEATEMLEAAYPAETVADLIQSAMNAELSRSHRGTDTAEPKGRTVVSGNRVADEPRPGGNIAEDVFAEMRSFLTNMRRDASDTEDPELAEYANAIEQFVTEAESAMNAQEREWRRAKNERR